MPPGKRAGCLIVYLFPDVGNMVATLMSLPTVKYILTVGYTITPGK